MVSSKDIPLIIGSAISIENSVWKLYILFFQLLERLCAPSFNNEELSVLNYFIKEFYGKDTVLFPEIPFKPKVHFLKHYPQMIRKFGPLVKTLPFEAKHSYFKNVYHCTNNRKNICKTLAKQHQFMMYLHYSKLNLLVYKYSLGSKVQEVALELVDVEKKEILQRKLAIEDSDLLCEMSSVQPFGRQQYHLGHVLLLDFVEDEYLFGIVDSVFSYNDTFYFYVEKMINKGFQFRFNSFELINSGKMDLYNINKLLDFQPLSIYNCNNMQLLHLKYFVPSTK